MGKRDRIFMIFLLVVVFGFVCMGTSRAEEDNRPAELSSKQRLEEVKAKEAKMKEAGKNVQKEAEEFNQIQATFCSDYHLDCGKFTQGLYTLDERKGEFILTEVEIPFASSEKKEVSEERE